MHFKDTDHGFEWGPIKVQRVMSDKREGWVVLGIETEEVSVELIITKTGHVRIHRWVMR